jgi:hypothetical protein
MADPVNEFETRKASREASSASRDVVQLKKKVLHLELINRAMWALLRDSGDFSENDLIQKVRAAEIEKANAPPKECVGCSRSNNSNRLKCLYCGEELVQDSVFDVF